MKIFNFLAASLLLSFSAYAQSVSDFVDMKKKEIQHILLTQQSSDLAKDYSQKHQKTRCVAYGFLVESGVIAVSGVVYHFTHSY